MTDIDPECRDAIAARLQGVRLSLGLNKAEFAQAADISDQSYGSFENSARDLTLIAAKKLHDRFGLSLDFLFFGTHHEDMPAPPKLPELDPTLARYLAQKPKDAQKQLALALQSLAD